MIITGQLAAPQLHFHRQHIEKSIDMYPADILALFPPFPRSNRVFIAMSFDHVFDNVWLNEFVPAIENTVSQGAPLVAHRVDLTRKSDAVMTEVVQEIAQSRLILADISTTGWLDREAGVRRPVRNANVMYELGIAHASRLAEEVIVVRGDNDALDFDIVGVRVHRYGSEPGEAQELVALLIKNALDSVDQRRHMAVQSAVKTLDPVMFSLLQTIGDVEHSVATTLGDFAVAQERQAAIQRLFDGGMFEAKYGPLPSNFLMRPSRDYMRCRITPFGAAVRTSARDTLGWADAATKWFATEEGKAWLQPFIASAKPPEATVTTTPAIAPLSDEPAA